MPIDRTEIHKTAGDIHPVGLGTWVDDLDGRAAVYDALGLAGEGGGTRRGVVAWPSASTS